MAELETMANIGREMARKLKSVGIRSAEKLTQTGSTVSYTHLTLPTIYSV